MSIGAPYTPKVDKNSPNPRRPPSIYGRNIKKDNNQQHISMTIPANLALMIVSSPIKSPKTNVKYRCISYMLDWGFDKK